MEKEDSEFKEWMSHLLKNGFTKFNISFYLYINKFKAIVSNPNYTDVIFQENFLFQRLSAAVFNSLKYMCGLHCRSEKNLSFKITMCGLASHTIEVSINSHENIFLYQSGILQTRWNMPSNELWSHIDIFDALQVSWVVHVSFERMQPNSLNFKKQN